MTDEDINKVNPHLTPNIIPNDDNDNYNDNVSDDNNRSDNIINPNVDVKQEVEPNDEEIPKKRGRGRLPNDKNIYIKKDEDNYQGQMFNCFKTINTENPIIVEYMERCQDNKKKMANKFNMFKSELNFVLEQKRPILPIFFNCSTN